MAEQIVLRGTNDDTQSTIPKRLPSDWTGVSVVPVLLTSFRSVLMCCRRSNERDVQRANRSLFAGLPLQCTGAPVDKRQHMVSSTQLTKSDGWGREMDGKQTKTNQ